MWNAKLDKAKAWINIARRNINNLRYADDITLMAESEEELESLLMKVKEESETAGLKLNIQKMKIMGRNINNLRYANDTTLMAENEEELKSLLMKVKEEVKKLA